MSGGYTPLFASIVTGTLYGRWPDIGLWPIVLAIADRHGVVDVTPHYLAGATGLPVDEVIACMKRFCEPDPYSRSKGEGGSRLTLLDDHRDWGWQVVNHGKYREKARKAAYDATRTESGADAERKRASRDVPTPPAMSSAVPLSDSDSNTNKTKTKIMAGRAPPDWFEEFKQAYPKRAGDQQWRKAISAGSARIAEGHQPSEFIAGAARYAQFVTVTGKASTEYVQQAARFLGPGKPFLLPWDPPAVAESATDEIKRLNSGGSHAPPGRVFEAEQSRTGLVPLLGNVRR